MIGKCGLTSRETDDKIKLSEVFVNGLPQSLRKTPSDMQSFESFRDEEFAAAKALSSTENVPTGKLRRRQRNGMVIARDKIGFRDFCAYKNIQRGKMKIFGIKFGEAVEQGVSQRLNLKYGDGHSFDVYRMGEERAPVVVHFSGAKPEERSKYAPMASRLAKSGFAVMVTSLPGQSGEDNVGTAKAFAEHLKFWGAGEKLELNSVFFSGDLAGAWTAFTAGLKACADESFFLKPIGLLGFSGVYEPMELAKLDFRAARKMIKTGFGVGKEGTLPEGVARLFTENSPPVFFAHSDADNLSFAGTAQLKSAIRRTGVPCSEYRAAFSVVRRDFYLKPDSAAGASVSAAAVRFMSKVLKGDFKGEYTEI